MTLTSDNVRVAVTGAIYMGPTTADAPTSPVAALDADFVDLGYFNEDGLAEQRSRETTDIKGHNGAIVRTLVTEGKATFKCVLIETKKETVELYYATTVTQTGTEGHFDVDPTKTGGRRSFVIDTIDGGEVERTYIAEGELTEVGDRSRKNSDATGYDVTITAYPSAVLGGNAFRTWMTALAS